MTPMESDREVGSEPNPRQPDAWARQREEAARPPIARLIQARQHTVKILHVSLAGPQPTSSG